MPCELIAGEERLSGTVEDINETGVLIRSNRQVLVGEDSVLFSVVSSAGERLTVEGRICRQKVLSSNIFEIGLNFIDIDRKTTDSLIAATFSDHHHWNQPQVEPGIFRSLWSIIRVFRMVFANSRRSHRYQRRGTFEQPCRMECQGRTVQGTVGTISKSGLSAKFAGTVDLIGEHGTLHVECLSFKVRRCWVMQCEAMVVAGFAIERVDKGTEQWRKITSLAA